MVAGFGLTLQLALKAQEVEVELFFPRTIDFDLR